ncbi:MAG TPA: hypothetical protein VGM90_20720 [Kofleriaceae bacterium]
MYEQRAGRWELAKTLSRDTWSSGIAIAGDRAVVHNWRRAEVYAQRAGVWTRTARVESPDENTSFWNVAASERWIVFRAIGSGNVTTLYVYDLAHDAKLAASLELAGDDADAGFAVDATTLAAAGVQDRRWRFDGTTWSEDRPIEGANRNGFYSRTVAIGDLIWIGDTARTITNAPPGFIHGFRID